MYKKSKNIERILFWWAKIQTCTYFEEKRQNRPSGIRFTGVLPPSTIYKNSKNMERTLFWWFKIQIKTLSKHVKIDPQEYDLQEFPSLYYLQKGGLKGMGRLNEIRRLWWGSMWQRQWKRLKNERTYCRRLLDLYVERHQWLIFCG